LGRYVLKLEQYQMADVVVRAEEKESPHDLHGLHSLPVPSDADLFGGITAFCGAVEPAQQSGMTDEPGATDPEGP
jgi:hypothetical protein